MKTVAASILALACFAAFDFLASDEVNELDQQVTHYCEMVQLWKDTNGEYGWPAYNGEGECK